MKVVKNCRRLSIWPWNSICVNIKHLSDDYIRAFTKGGAQVKLSSTIESFSQTEIKWILFRCNFRGLHMKVVQNECGILKNQHLKKGCHAFLSVFEKTF